MAAPLRRTALVAACLGAGLSLAATAVGGPASSARMAPADEAKIELGRRLFFEPRASRTGMRSCADCHDPEHGFSEPLRVSRDDRGPTRRHSQTVVDAADNPSAHWDGAFTRLEHLVAARATMTQRGRWSWGHEPPVPSARAGFGAGRDAGVGGGDPFGGSGASGDPADAPGVGTPEPGTAPDDDPAGHPDTGSSAGAGTQQAQGGDASGGGTPSSGGPGQGSTTEGGGSGQGSTTEGGGSGQGGATEGGNSGGSGGAFYGRDGAHPPTQPSEPSAPPPAATPSAPPAQPSPSAPQGSVPPAPAPSAPGAAAPGAKAAPDAGAGDPAASRPKDDRFEAPRAAPGDEPLDYLAHDLDIGLLPLSDRAIEEAGRYREAFVAAYGSPEVTVARVAEAVAAYCRSVRSGPSAFDRFAAGDEAALTAAQKRGLDLFRGRGRCASCHDMSGPRAAFTDYAFHNTGVTWNGIRADDDEARASRAADADQGVAAAGGSVALARAFKTPTLRDVARRGPWMHDGSMRTLEACVRHYGRGTTDPLADRRLPRAGFSDAEVADLVAFLGALTSDERPGLAASAWKARARLTRLRFVDADGRPLAGQDLRLEPAGDRLPGPQPSAPPPTVTTDEDGWVHFAPPSRTHVRIRLPDGLVPEDGAWVPDTCREAVVRVPVRGEVRAVVTMPAGSALPPSMVAEHAEAKVFHDRRRPATVLRLVDSGEVGGKPVGTYAAPRRTDVSGLVALRLPVRAWGMDRLRVWLDPKKPVRLDLSRR